MVSEGNIKKLIPDMSGRGHFYDIFLILAASADEFIGVSFMESKREAENFIE